MRNAKPQKDPIAVFDSGVGGLSILRAIWKELPSEKFIYLADQAHVPYGSRSLPEVRSFSHEVTRFLHSQGSQIIVLACNTASAAALNYLRVQFPNLAFVGMEPAIKPAATLTASGVVGVLATPATFQGELYASVVERFANGVEVLQETCPGLVQQIELGKLDTPQTETILRKALEPMVEKQVDTIVLGCTHYPFVMPLIDKILDQKATVIDPAPAIARQVRRLLIEHTDFNADRLSENRHCSDFPQTVFFTTGSVNTFKGILQQFLHIDATVRKVYWVGSSLSISYRYRSHQWEP